MSILDSNLFISTLKCMSNQQKPKKKFKQISKTAKKSKFTKIFRNLKNCKNVCHSVKFQYFDLQFFAKVLILIVFYKENIRLRSCWVIFENSKGPKREVPCYDKSQMIKKHISKAKNSIISNFGMGREVLFTPLPLRRYG